jgi:hypothetical protein
LFLKASIQFFILIEPFVCYVAIITSFLRKLSGWCDDFQLSFDAIIHIIEAIRIFELTVSSILNDVKVDSFETLVSVIKLSDQWEVFYAKIFI